MGPAEVDQNKQSWCVGCGVARVLHEYFKKAVIRKGKWTNYALGLWWCAECWKYKDHLVLTKQSQTNKYFMPWKPKQNHK
jgi:hypothetical protein